MRARSSAALVLTLLLASNGRPAAAEDEALSFTDAVSRALQHNPQAQVAVEEIARAEALVEQTRAASLPTLIGNAAYTRLDGDRVLGGRVIAGADQLAANLTIAVPLVAPSRWVQWSHARQGVALARLSAEEVRRQLALTTARTYLGVIAQRRAVEVSERAARSASDHYQFAHQRFAGGYGSRLDEVRAAQELAIDRSQTESARLSLARLRESLGVLVGADHAIDVLEPVALPPPPDAAEALGDLPRLRSDVRLSHDRLALATRVAHDDWADYLPTLTGTFQPFYQNPPTLTVPETGWQAQLALSWPIYDGGLRYGLAHERSSLRREAEASLEGTLRQASSDVRSAAESLRRAAASLEDAREAARLAADALGLTTLAYRAGASTNLEVIDAERRARDADSAVAAAEDTQRQAQLDLLVASGRFPR